MSWARWIVAGDCANFIEFVGEGNGTDRAPVRRHDAPRSGVQVMDAEMRSLLRRVQLQQQEAVVEAAGLTLKNVVKATIFIRDMGEFANINEVYQGFFPADPPARSVVEVSRLPKDVLVEIEMVAYG